MTRYTPGIFYTMPGVGFEPTCPFGRRVLSPVCKPFHHPGPPSWNTLCNESGYGETRRGSESNRCIRVLQTLALPLGYRAEVAGSLGMPSDVEAQPIALPLGYAAPITLTVRRLFQARAAARAGAAVESDI